MLTQGQKVRAIRYIRQCRQVDLAELAGIDASTLHAFEADKRATRKTRRKIEAALGYGLSDPPVEAAFSILTNDYASADLVTLALALLVQANGR